MTNAAVQRVKVKDEKIIADQFAHIKDKDLRCRNIAVMIMNYFEDKGEEQALMYTAVNVKPRDEEHVKAWVRKIATERGYQVKEQLDA